MLQRFFLESKSGWLAAHQQSTAQGRTGIHPDTDIYTSIAGGCNPRDELNFVNALQINLAKSAINDKFQLFAAFAWAGEHDAVWASSGSSRDSVFAAGGNLASAALLQKDLNHFGVRVRLNRIVDFDSVRQSRSEPIVLAFENCCVVDVQRGATRGG